MSEQAPSLNSRTLQACVSGDVDALAHILTAQGVKKGDTPIQAETWGEPSLPSNLPYTYEMLVAAIEGKHVDTISYLLATFPSVELHDTILLATTEEPSIPVFEVLLKHDGKIVNHEFQDMFTPLIAACQRNHDDFAIYLLEKGADPNIEGMGPWRALYYALDRDQPRLDLIKKMVQCGANMHDRHVLERAVEKGQVEVITIFLNAGLDVQTRGVRLGDCSLLYCAVKNRQVAISRVLLDHGADPEAKDGEGRSVRDIAMSSGNEKLVSLFRIPSSWRSRLLRGVGLR